MRATIQGDGIDFPGASNLLPQRRAAGLGRFRIANPGRFSESDGEFDMKWFASLCLCCAALMSTGGCGPQASIPNGIQVYFSPGGGATEAVVSALNQATNSVLVQAYSFTSAPIAQALVEARRRGVKTRVILDGSQRTEKYSEADFLAHSDIPTLIDARHAIAHNKVMVIDGYAVITGSFNFTLGAEEKNAENLLIINDPALAGRYIDNWRAHEAHAEPYERGKRPEERPARREKLRY